MDHKDNLCGYYLQQRRLEQRTTLAELRRLLKREGYVYSLEILKNIEEGRARIRDIDVLAFCEALHIAPIDLFPIEDLLWK